MGRPLTWCRSLLHQPLSAVPPKPSLAGLGHLHVPFVPRSSAHLTESPGRGSGEEHLLGQDRWGRVPAAHGPRGCPPRPPHSEGLSSVCGLWSRVWSRPVHGGGRAWEEPWRRPAGTCKALAGMAQVLQGLRCPELGHLHALLSGKGRDIGGLMQGGQGAHSMALGKCSPQGQWSIQALPPTPPMIPWP